MKHVLTYSPGGTTSHKNCNFNEITAFTTVCDSIPCLSVFSDLPMQRECHLQEFMCNTSVCIPRSKVCDLNADCLNGDDEDDNLCGEKTPYLRFVNSNKIVSIIIINACVRVADVMTFTFVSLMPVYNVCRICKIIKE